MKTLVSSLLIVFILLLNTLLAQTAGKETNVGKEIEKELLEGFCSKDIKTIIFSKGGAGCFGEKSSDTMVYELKETRFVLSRKVFTGGAIVDLKVNANEINKQEVVAFVKEIPAIYRKQSTINELGLTQQDYDTCKRNILAFKKVREREIRTKKQANKRTAFTLDGYNLDFPRLLALVDSVKTIDQRVLDRYFAFYDFKQGNLWARIIFVNANNEMLEIENISYGIPSPFYFPWVIKLNGARSVNSTGEINRFLQTVFPNFLDHPTSRVEVIQGLVKYLYWRL